MMLAGGKDMKYDVAGAARGAGAPANVGDDDEMMMTR